MKEQFPHGAPEYYLAVATLIPFLLISYLFSMRVLEALKKLIKGDVGIMLTILGVSLPLIAIVAALFGETYSLIALFTGDPESLNTGFSLAGLIVFPVVGVLHLVIVEQVDRRGGNAEAPVTPAPPVVPEPHTCRALICFTRSYRR